MTRRVGGASGWGLAAGAAGALLVASCASAPPDAPPLAEFEAAATKAEVVRLTGIPPSRCTWSRPDFEICTWRLANRNPAWWTLAPSVGTKYQVNLVCEFASDGSASVPCSVYPRKARPLAATPAVAAAGSGEPSGQVDAATARGEAQSLLDSALTVREMTELVGDAPDRCAAPDERDRLCTWRIGNQAQGYEIVAATLGASGRVQLSCRFPGDGGARESGSCQVFGQ